MLEEWKLFTLPRYGLTPGRRKGIQDSRLVSITRVPPREVVVTGLTRFDLQQNLASMIAFVMNVSGQPIAIHWLTEWCSLLILESPRLS